MRSLVFPAPPHPSAFDQRRILEIKFNHVDNLIKYAKMKPQLKTLSNVQGASRMVNLYVDLEGDKP
jgi:hypothetical protein